MYERRENYKLIRELERFKKLFLEAFDAIFIFDLNGRILDVNKSAQELTGYSREELLKMDSFDLRPPEESKRVRQILHVLRTQGVARGISDTHYKRKDGTLVPVEINAKVITVDREAYILNISRDITERKKIEAEIRERNENLEILNEVGIEITSRLNLREILPRVVKSAVKIVGGDAGVIGFITEKDRKIEYPYGYNMPDSLASVIATDGLPIIQQVIRTGKPIIVGDFAAFGKAYRCFASTGVKSLMLVPISAKGMVFGVLGVFNFSTDKRFTERGLWLLENIARQAAVAIENSRLFEEVHRRAKQSEAANKVSRIISSTLDLSEVLRLVINEISEAIGTEAGGIFFYNADENRFYGKMGYGPTRRYVQDIIEDASNFRLADEAVKTRNIVLIENAQADPRIPRKYVAKFNLQSILVLPLIVKDKIIGVVSLAHTDKEHRFDEDQIAFAKSIAAQSAIAIENARLYEAERYVANVLQKSFLPAEVPEIPNTSIAAYYTTSSEVGQIGGDFYDFIQLPGSLIALVVGDVSGKGIEVASTTSLAKYTTRAFAYQTKHASRVLESANEVIAREIEPGSFITVVYVIYDWESGRLLVSNGGHPFPIHYVAKQNKAHLIENINAALGILPDLGYSELVEKLEEGDVLVLYTDGLTEARRGNQFYGTDRLMQIVTNNAHLPAEKLINQIVADVYAFAEGKLTDDIALNVLKRV